MAFQKPMQKKNKFQQKPFNAQPVSSESSNFAPAPSLQSNQASRQFRNIVIIGMPGSGKSSLAKSYASLTKRQFLDVDKYIELNAGKTIPQIFAQTHKVAGEEISGEAFFRSLEKKAIEKMMRRNNSVISLGGGAVQTEEMFSLIQQLGLVVSLHSGTQTLAKRIFENKEARPLFANCHTEKEAVKVLNELIQVREPFLNKADVCLNSEFGSVDSLKLELKWHEREYFRRDWVRDMLNCVGKEYLTDTNPFERFRRRFAENKMYPKKTAEESLAQVSATSGSSEDAKNDESQSDELSQSTVSEVSAT